MATDLGKVGIVMKGNWSSSATYEGLDAVSYNGGFYIAKQAVPANTVPTNTTYWQVAVSRNRVVFENTQSITMSTTMFYTGISITIPANKCFAFWVSMSYSNSKPEEIAINGNGSTYQAYNNVAYTAGCGASYCGKTRNVETTYYIWARGNNTNANPFTISGWYED